MFMVWEQAGSVSEDLDAIECQVECVAIAERADRFTQGYSHPREKREESIEDAHARTHAHTHARAHDEQKLPSSFVVHMYIVLAYFVYRMEDTCSGCVASAVVAAGGWRRGVIKRLSLEKRGWCGFCGVCGMWHVAYSVPMHIVPRTSYIVHRYIECMSTKYCRRLGARGESLIFSPYIHSFRQTHARTLRTAHGAR